MLENRHLRLDLCAVGLLALTVFLAVSLLTYSPADAIGELPRPLDSWYQQDVLHYPQQTEVINACGRAGAIVADLLTAAPRLRFYFTEFGHAIARRTHDVGLLASISPVNYARAKAYVAGDDARRAADVPELRAMVAALMKLSVNRFHIDGAYDKMLFRVSDRDFPLRLLPPYVAATEEDFAQFLAALPAGWRTTPSP